MMHTYRECATSDGKLCARCEFRERLTAHVDRMAEARESKWDAFQGEFVDTMHDAIYALHRARRERFTDKHDEIANAWEAATRLIELFENVGRLRQQLMADVPENGDVGLR